MPASLLQRLRNAAASLKVRLAVTSFVLIATSVALTAFFVLRDMQARSQRAVLDTQTAEVQRFAAVVSSRLVSLQTSMRSAADRLVVGDAATTATTLAFLQEQVVLRSLFDSVFVMLPEGRLVAIASVQGIKESQVNTSDRAYFRKTLEQRRPVISEPVVSRISGDPVVILTMPVENKSGAVAAVIGCGMRLNSHSVTSDLTRAEDDGTDPVVTMVVDSTGRIISHPNSQWVMREGQTEPRFAAAVDAWIAQGRPVEPQGSARRFGEHLVAVAGVPDADWVIFRSAPAEVLLGGPTAGRLQTIGIGAVVALAGGLITLSTTFLLLRPLRRLESRALRLLTTDLPPEDGWPGGNGELGKLSRVFQHVMKERAAIQKSGDELFEKMHAVMGNAPVGIAFTRMSHFELVSDHFGVMFGYSARAIVGEPTHMICLSEDAHRALGARVAAAFAAGQMFDEEIELRRADGSTFWARRQGAPVHSGQIAAGTIWIITDITESRGQREQLSWTASHDALTGLANRREFELRLADQLRERRGAEPAAALFIDLDRFKAVNDTAGHAAGDALLKDIAGILTTRARSNDTVARLGGDEFAVLLRGCGRSAAETVANQIRTRVLAYELRWESHVLSVGASIGVVEIEAAMQTADAVMAAADAACYDAKRSGRNAVRIYRSTPEVQPVE